MRCAVTVAAAAESPAGGGLVADAMLLHGGISPRKMPFYPPRRASMRSTVPSCLQGVGEGADSRSTMVQWRHLRALAGCRNGKLLANAV